MHKPTTITLYSFKKLIFIVSCGQPCLVWSQDSLPECVWTQFEHANGTPASAGCMVAGVPVGVWKSYSELGELISEGARENNLPEGSWWFYDQGQVREEVHYSRGLKHGIQVLHHDGMLTDSVVWVQGQKEGDAKSFRPDGTLKLTTPYQRNIREGKAIQFNNQEEPCGFRWYKIDRLVASEVFNRRDENGLKTGLWKVFHTSGRVLESGSYMRNVRHGLFQFFDARGTLVRVERYHMGELVVEDNEEGSQPELQEVHRRDGSLESTTMYIQGVKQGVSRTFNNQGEVVAGAIFDQDELVAEGITLKDGTKDGVWREFWPNGQVRAEGLYESGLREGIWTFYRITSEKEQEGNYRQGVFHGTWTWWYLDGEIHREEDYTRGKLDGEFLELDTVGGVLVKGTFVGGDPEGPWIRNVHNHLEEGNYLSGQKDGVWRMTDASDVVRFEGMYSFGQPVGKHKYWHPNGVVEEVGKYESGAKHGKWRLYDDQGNLLHEYIYNYGKLRKVDGSKVDKRRDGKR